MVGGSSDSLASYIDLHAAHRSLQNAHATTQQELEALKREHEELLRSFKESDSPSVKTVKEDSKGDVLWKAEVDRLQAELSKSEEVIAASEQTTTKQQRTIEALTKEVEELSAKAEQADKLKDEVDEYRHAAEKSRKLEATVDKYKKKLEEAAETKRVLKGLEEENQVLLEKNARLEDDYQNVSHLKDLIEQYKGTIASLESKNSAQAKEHEALKLTSESNEQKIAELEARNSRQSEDVSLLEERVKQLEGAPPGLKQRRGNDTLTASASTSEDEDGVNDLSGMANELDDAMSGVSTTELKLKIRKLQREVDALRKNKTDSSRILVLENLLEDAQNMKARYEQEFLKEHKEKLVLQRQIDQIREGGSTVSNE